MEINKLAASAKEGDREAFEQLYGHFAQKIFYYVRMKIQNRQDAEDITQEIFIKSYKGLGTLRPGEINFAAWLFKIAGNTINDHLRKKYRTPEIISIDEGLDVAGGRSLYQSVASKLDFEKVCESFVNLSARHRSVMELTLFNQLSVGEVAQALKTSSMAVRIMQYRARKRLKQIVLEVAYS